MFNENILTNLKIYLCLIFGITQQQSRNISTFYIVINPHIVLTNL